MDAKTLSQAAIDALDATLALRACLDGVEEARSDVYLYAADSAVSCLVDVAGGMELAGGWLPVAASDFGFARIEAPSRLVEGRSDLMELAHAVADAEDFSQGVYAYLHGKGVI